MPVKELKIISPLGSPSAVLVPEKPDVHKVARKIYGLESSFGKFDTCRQQGQYNGYGYGQNSDIWNCFESFEIVTGKVEAWIQDKLAKNYTLAETLCTYNVGKKVEDCDYYKNFLAL